MLYTAERQRVMIKIISGIEINFFDNLHVGQMLSNVYLPKKISTCPKKKVLYVLRLTWKKALNLQNTRSFENQVFVCDH